jgi:dTDP-4-dehydrorhamnose reductase
MKMIRSALIGHSGFVGSTLLRQTQFGSLYRSSNVHDIAGRNFDIVVCAGAPAQKWVANSNPEADLQNIDSLIKSLRQVTCRKFILVSTVDVFRTPVAVDETTPVDEEGLHAYGANRRKLEKFVEGCFPEHLIVRLPGLIGPGLRKNVIFDLLNDNNLAAVDSRAIFQFYPMVNFWYDVSTALAADLRLVHFTAEPIAVRDVARYGFGKSLEHCLNASPAQYDMRSVHANIFGAAGAYQYNARETLQAIRAYAQSESRTLPRMSGA